MKTISITNRTQRTGAQRLRLTAFEWMLAGLAIATTATLIAQNARDDSIPDSELLEHSILNVPLDQLRLYPDALDSISIKWARAAMHNPRLALDLRDQLKTPERRDAEHAAALAILNPEEFRRQRDEMEAARGPKSPDELAAQQHAARQAHEALHGILHPVEVAREKENIKTAETRRREAIAQFAVLNPREFNQRIEPYKTDELRRQEANIIHAFADPEGFRRKYEQLKKGAPKQLPNLNVEPTNTTPNVRPNRPEKGAEGGSQ